jgi:hypothetical protein
LIVLLQVEEEQYTEAVKAEMGKLKLKPGM